jgi:hypothetical protein
VFFGVWGGGDGVVEERERGYGHKHADNALCLNQSTSSGIIFASQA